VEKVYDKLEEYLGQIMVKKPLREYGMTEDQVDSFTKSTLENQQRLLGNNYVFLEDAEIREIFANLY
jgi:4-hydroxybutyrate dehydrogenase